MRNKKLSIIGIFTLFMIIVLAGCGSGESNQASSEKEADNKAEEEKEELVLAFGLEPDDGFDPTAGWGRYGSPLFQSTILKRDDDLNVVNDLAKDYEVSEDGKEWTITLRDDVKFSDGEPLTASDIKFTYDTAAEAGSVVDLQVIDKVNVIDETNVEFILKEKQSTFINTLVATGIVPEHAYDKDYATNPVGSGPFKFVQWDKGQQLIVEANPEYYDTKPYFKKLTFLFLNEDAAFAAAQAGTVDITYIPAAFSNQEVPGMKLETVQTVDNRGISFPYVKSGETTEDGILIGNDVTSDLAIRKAIDIAVDREALIDSVLEGHGTPAYTSVDGLPWWNSETVIEDNDLEGASKILEEAGWEDKNGDGILEKDSLKAEFELYYSADDTIRQSLAISVADMLKPLGINIKVKGASWDIIEQKMHSEATLLGWGSHNPGELSDIYGSENAGLDFYNTGFYKNKTVDKYFDQAFKAESEEEALEYWKKAQWDGETGLSGKGDAPWIWLVNIDHLYLAKDNLDIGKQRIHVHGHGWPATDNIVDWKWSK